MFSTRKQTSMNGPNPILSGMPGVIEFKLEKEATPRQKDDRETREEELLFSKNLKGKCTRSVSGSSSL